MIDALIFSRDRPMQLEACLRSLERSAPGLFRFNVIYGSHSTESDHGYDDLEAPHAVNWMCDSEGGANDFRGHVFDFLPTATEHLLVLCDDAITFGKIIGNPIEAFADDVICLALRLGENTVYCHPRDLHHGVPEFEERDPFIVWDWHGPTPDGDLFDWQGREGDFGYPYSLDGTIHRRDSLLEWIDGGQFVNPNQMEGCVVHAIGQRRDLPPLMASYPHSIQVGLPINVVNQTHGNRFGLIYPVETAELNERFLNGQRIDLDAMDFSNIIGAHQEVKLEFTP